jgi:hypothetical protein
MRDESNDATSRVATILEAARKRNQTSAQDGETRQKRLINAAPSGAIYPDGVQKTRPLFPAFA